MTTELSADVGVEIGRPLFERCHVVPSRYPDQGREVGKLGRCESAVSKSAVEIGRYEVRHAQKMGIKEVQCQKLDYLWNLQTLPHQRPLQHDCLQRCDLQQHPLATTTRSGCLS